MKWYENLDEFLHKFEVSGDAMDETAFYFRTDPLEIEHCIGCCISTFYDPFWVGLCDVRDGCEFKTARELLEAPIYDGKSIRDRWEEVCIYQIGGLVPDEWYPY